MRTEVFLSTANPSPLTELARHIVKANIWGLNESKEVGTGEWFAFALNHKPGS